LKRIEIWDLGYFEYFNVDGMQTNFVTQTLFEKSANMKPFSTSGGSKRPLFFSDLK
jgi:hypothetical protein